jgi:hypothetical protein
MTRFRETVLVMAAALVGVYQALHPGPEGFGRGFEMATLARNLAEHGAYANPFPPAITGPSAFVPPLYPMFLAAILKLTGSPQGMAILALCLTIFANALIALLLPRLSNVLFNDWRPGAFAAVLWIASMRMLPQWDMSCTIAGQLIFCLLAARGASAAGCGVVAGLLLLLNPSTLFVTLPWMAYLLYQRRVTLRSAAVVAITMGLCVTPWIARNYAVWHAVVLRNSFGTTLYSSNNDCAESSLWKEGRSGCFQATHPVANAAEIAVMQRLGEYRYDRLRQADAMRWIRLHPARFLRLTAARMVEFWFPEPAIDPHTAYVMWLATILSIPGMVLLVRRRATAALYIGAVWLLYPPLYYVMLSMDRYRYPILWTSLLPAGYFLAAAAQQLARSPLLLSLRSRGRHHGRDVLVVD